MGTQKCLLERVLCTLHSLRARAREPDLSADTSHNTLFLLVLHLPLYRNYSAVAATVFPYEFLLGDAKRFFYNTNLGSEKTDFKMNEYKNQYIVLVDHYCRINTFLTIIQFHKLSVCVDVVQILFLFKDPMTLL